MHFRTTKNNRPGAANPRALRNRVGERSTWKWKRAINVRSRYTLGINSNLILGVDFTGFSEMAPHASNCCPNQEDWTRKDKRCRLSGYPAYVARRGCPSACLRHCGSLLGPLASSALGCKGQRRG